MLLLIWYPRTKTAVGTNPRALRDGATEVGLHYNYSAVTYATLGERASSV